MQLEAATIELVEQVDVQPLRATHGEIIHRK
jgi:hypothetical protein